MLNLLPTALIGASSLCAYASLQVAINQNISNSKFITYQSSTLSHFFKCAQPTTGIADLGTFKNSYIIDKQSHSTLVESVKNIKITGQ
jgi:hypothetical protein